MSELRIGVIGVGGRGWLAKHAHRPDEGVRITAGADPNPDAIAAFKNDHGCDAFTTDDYRRLLDRSDVDAVFVTSPDFLHTEHALAAIEAGKAVYLEKPMAITVEGCDRILRAARERKVSSSSATTCDTCSDPEDEGARRRGGDRRGPRRRGAGTSSPTAATPTSATGTRSGSTSTGCSSRRAPTTST